MENKTKTITIGRDVYGYYYRDSDEDISAITMLEAYGMYLARLAATIQHDADEDHYVEYQFDIKKTIID